MRYMFSKVSKGHIQNSETKIKEGWQVNSGTGYQLANYVKKVALVIRFKNRRSLVILTALDFISHVVPN